jgi:hypothetical protein
MTIINLILLIIKINKFKKISFKLRSNPIKIIEEQKLIMSQIYKIPNFIKRIKFSMISKQNNLNKTNLMARISPSGAAFSPLNKENLFTKPEILDMIKHDRNRAKEREKKFSNINFSYIP